MVIRKFGELDDVRVRDTYTDRLHAYDEGVHRTLEAGICGGQYEGAESVVVNGIFGPNHHVLLDTGAIYIDAAFFFVRAATGEKLSHIVTQPEHAVSADHLAYHRDHWAI